MYRVPGSLQADNNVQCEITTAPIFLIWQHDGQWRQWTADWLQQQLNRRQNPALVKWCCSAIIVAAGFLPVDRHRTVVYRSLHAVRNRTRTGNEYHGLFHWKR